MFIFETCASLDIFQMDGAATSSSDRILCIGATNIPWDIDEAVLRYVVIVCMNCGVFANE